MGVRREARGSGLTETETWIFDAELSPDEAALQEKMQELHTVEGRLAYLEGLCGPILEAAGLPPRCGNYICNNESGDWEIGGKLRAGWTSTESPWTIAQKRGYAEDSKVGFAARIVENCRWLRKAREEGNADRAMMLSFYLGHKVASSAIKTGHGNKTAREGPRKSGRDIQMAISFLERRRRRLTDTALKVAIGKQHGLGRSAAIEAVNRGLKKLSG
jgi:hypothetical protein